MLLAIKNLTFGWDEEPLFHNISGQLQPGAIVQLTGENGVGKTSLLQLISGMIPHFSRGKILMGDIFINGRSIIQQSPQYFFPTIAFIPGTNLDFFLLSECLAQEILLCRSILNITPDQAQAQQDKFVTFFPELRESAEMPFKDMQVDQKILSLLLIYYLQKASLFLFDEMCQVFSRSLVDRWYSFIELLSASGCGIIFVDHHLRPSRYPRWQLKNKQLIT